MKRQGSLKFVSYLVAICIGVVAGALAWQSYGGDWIEQFGWTKPPPGHQNAAIRSSVRETPQAALVAQTAPVAVTPTAVAQQTVAQSLAAVRETLEQLAARQDQMEHDITKLQAVDMKFLRRSHRLWRSPSPSLRANQRPSLRNRRVSHK